jgi:hypothetical protein
MRYEGEWEIKFAYLPTEVEDVGKIKCIWWKHYMSRIIWRADWMTGWDERYTIRKYLADLIYDLPPASNPYRVTISG